MSNFKAVSFARHGKYRWKWPADHRFAARTSRVPIYALELGSAVAAMPVAFIEGEGRYSLAALTSLLPDRNEFVAADGKWLGRFVPVHFRLYPFRLLPSSETGAPILCFDEDSGVLDPTGQSGLPFFSPDGAPSAALQEVAGEFRRLDSMRQRTEDAIAALAAAGIIRPWKLTLQEERGASREVTGLHCADEDVMNALDDAAFTALRRAWALPFAYGQLYSTNQAASLAELGRSNTLLSGEGKPVAPVASPAPAPPEPSSPRRAPSASPPSRATQRKIASLFSQAQSRTQANQLGKAESLCRKILELDDGHAESWQMLGAIALRSGRMDLAAKMSEKAIALKPESPTALYVLGNALKAQGDAAGAIASYERAVALKPDHVDALTNLGSALADEGRTEEAMARHEQVLALKPKSPLGLYNLGLALFALGKKDEAIDRYRQALALKPDYVEALSNLGGVLTSQSKLAEAVFCYERALSIRPGLPELLNNLGQAQFGQGKLSAAIANVLVALRNSGLSIPSDVDATSSLGAVLGDLPDDQAFTPHQEEYVASLMLFSLSEQGIESWSEAMAPLRRFKWSPALQLNILVNQAISHWLRGDLDSHRDIVAEADRALGRLGANLDRNAVANRAYHNYLKRLLAQPSRSFSGSPGERPATVVGDSHALSYAGLGLEIEGQPCRTKAELVMGAKAWHLATASDNRFKKRFEWAIDRAAQGSIVLCSFGEIDCRLDEGILSFFRKKGGSLEDIIRGEVADYVSYVGDRLSLRRLDPLFLGVPAPFFDSPGYGLGDATLEDQRLLVDIIQLFNANLKDAAAQRGFAMADLYALTNDRAGKASGRWHVDGYHLKPEALAAALRQP